MNPCIRKGLLSSVSRQVSRYATQATSATPTAPSVTAVQYPYFVPRNSRGSLPVYTDIRNAGGRCMILVRNVEGDVNAFTTDLRRQLLDSPTTKFDMSRLQVEVVRSKHLVLYGATPRMKNEVTEWLNSKGF